MFNIKFKKNKNHFKFTGDFIVLTVNIIYGHGISEHNLFKKLILFQF